MSRVLGIDPGKAGGAVVLDGRTVLAATRTSDIIGTAKWQAAHMHLTRWLRSQHAAHRIDLAVLELFAGRSQEGRGSAMTTGVGWGIWLGALSALEIPVLTPAAQSWTAQMFRGIQGEGKERSIAVASMTLPDLDLMPGRCKKPQDGLADAACLALYGASHALGRGAA